VKEAFTVVNTSNTLVSGIPTAEFTAHLFNPNDEEVDLSTVTYAELGYGHYRASFIPNQVGNWLFVVYHPTHFPWGKSNNIQVFANDFDSIASMLQRVLGLVQENFSVDQAIYDADNNLTSSRVRTYSDSSSIGTDSNIIATYQMTATYNESKMTFYKMEKI
jgi:hypothetical protein